jgi:flagellar hook-basal body complex protein FliE
MSALDAIAAIGVSSLPGAAQALPTTSPVAPSTASPLGGFGNLLSDGLSQVDEKVATADRLVRSFALDESSVPIHQVTIALEEARIAIEMAMQVRTRLVEAYRELMNMQL